MDPVDELAANLGSRLRRGRQQGRWRQSVVGARAGVSQTMISRMELGRGASIALDEWASVADAVGLQFTASMLPIAPRPLPVPAARRCHALIADLASVAGWTSVTEITAVAGDEGCEQIHTTLARPRFGEVALVRVWDALASVEVVVAELLAAIEQEGANHTADTRVSGFAVSTWTPNNRRRVNESRPILRDALPGSGADWLRAMEFDRARMPRDAALLWAVRDGSRLRPTPRSPGWQVA